VNLQHCLHLTVAGVDTRESQLAHCASFEPQGQTAKVMSEERGTGISGTSKV